MKSSPSVELCVGTMPAPGEVQVRGVVDLHAAHRHAARPGASASICSTGAHQGRSSRARSYRGPMRLRRGDGVQLPQRNFGGGANAVARRPLVLRVGDDHRAVGELDLVARPAQHDLGRRDHPRRLPVGAEQLVADRDLAHRRPAGRRRQRGVQRQRLPDTGPGRDDDHLPRMQTVGHLVEFGEPRRHAARDPALGGDGVDLVHRRLQQLFQRHEVFGRARRSVTS